MPKRPNPYDLNHVARIRRAKLSPRPCPDCGKDQLVGTDGKTWCVHGGHALERELGLRPKKVKP